MKPNVPILLSIFLFLSACNAYRTTPDSEILFTKKDLTKNGFIVAPVIDVSPKSANTVADLNAYDSILTNTLKSLWPSTSLMSTSEITQNLEGEDEEIEGWRGALVKEDQNQKQKSASNSSPSSVEITRKLIRFGSNPPKQVLLASVLQNSVSCGQKEVLATYLSPDPKGFKGYCQRIMKMRFRILDVQKNTFVWNGIIYATQESTQPSPAARSEEDNPLEPPSTQSLIRDCFTNFARQFSEN